MEKVRKNIYHLTLLMTFISVAFVLVSSGKQREFFYIAIYLSIIGLIIEYKKLTSRPFSIAIPILLIGILNLGWYFMYEYQNEGINVFSDYIGSSKKLILGSLLVLYIDRFKSYIPTEKFKVYFLIATGTGLLMATVYGFWQSSQGVIRVEMATNRATISAYVYSALSLAFIYGLYLQKKRGAYILAAAIILISYVIILMTGTRAAMGIFIILAFVLTLYHFKKIHIKSCITLLVITAAIITIGYKPYIAPKLKQTTIEIADFNKGNDNTSLGARFSMWIVGVENGLNHPLGQSIESRKQWSAGYTEKHPHLKTAMQYMDIHLHNEFIEKYSLQGILGVILLLFFYGGLLSSAIKNSNSLLFITTLSLFIYGFTDVLLISSEAVIFYITLFALSTHLSQREKTIIT